MKLTSVDIAKIEDLLTSVENGVTKESLRTSLGLSQANQLSVFFLVLRRLGVGISLYRVSPAEMAEFQEWKREKQLRSNGIAVPD